MHETFRKATAISQFFFKDQLNYPLLNYQLTDNLKLLLCLKYLHMNQSIWKACSQGLLNPTVTANISEINLKIFLCLK